MPALAKTQVGNQWRQMGKAGMAVPTMTTVSHKENAGVPPGHRASSMHRGSRDFIIKGNGNKILSMAKPHMISKQNEAIAAMIGKKHDSEESKQAAFSALRRPVPKVRKASQGGLPKKELKTQNSEIVQEKKKNLFEFKAPPDSTQKKKQTGLFEPILAKEDKSESPKGSFLTKLLLDFDENIDKNKPKKQESAKDAKMVVPRVGNRDLTQIGKSAVSNKDLDVVQESTDASEQQQEKKPKFKVGIGRKPKKT